MERSPPEVGCRITSLMTRCPREAAGKGVCDPESPDDCRRKEEVPKATGINKGKCFFFLIQLFFMFIYCVGVSAYKCACHSAGVEVRRQL